MFKRGAAVLVILSGNVEFPRFPERAMVKKLLARPDFTYLSVQKRADLVDVIKLGAATTILVPNAAQFPGKEIYPN